jgi:hypothetical protein
MTDDCTLENFFKAIDNPRGFLKPGEKIGSAQATIIERGGIRSLFAPGLSFEDAISGKICKPILIADGNGIFRKDLKSSLEGTAFTTYGAPTLQDALRIADFYEVMRYAVVSDSIPRERGEQPQCLVDELYDSLSEKFPEIKVFAYVTENTQLDRPYQGVIVKGTEIREIYRMLIKDAEQVTPSEGIDDE